MKLDFDVVVIGAGISGMTAAIYLKRSNASVAILEENAPGGQINRTSKIENYPGFNVIDGPTLAYNVFMQIQNLGIPYKYGKAIDIIDKKDYKVIVTNKEEIKCKAIIIATGRKPKELGLPNEKTLIGKGISWCSICDGPLYKDMDVVVVGNNKHALEESLFLSEICSSITIINDKDKFDEEHLLNKLNEKVKIIYNATVNKLNEIEKKLDSIDILISDKEENIKTKALFIFMGSVPVSDMIKNVKVKTKDGYILVDENMRTNIKGIYACGDIIKKSFYQISTAVGEGAIAALNAIKDLK